MHSCIYEGKVTHRRLIGQPHRFRQSVFMMYLDLEEVPQVFADRWLWSATGPAIARFRRSDYHGDATQPLADCVRQSVEERTGFRPPGPIRMLTNLRYWGYLINPISVYYCFDEAERLLAVLAEVTNTPWGERHCYALDLRPTRDDFPQSKKALHVSPFMSMDMQYRWRIVSPGQQLSIGITNLQEDTIAFQAAAVLQKQTITSSNLARVLVQYPFMTAQIAGNIYYQALRLWWKGVPFVPHPDKVSPPTASSPSSHVITNPGP